MEDMEIEDKILCEFISEVLPITWGMVTTILPVISSIEACVNDPHAHLIVAESQEQTQVITEWVCSQPALYRCLDPSLGEKGVVSPRGECVNTPIISFNT